MVGIRRDPTENSRIPMVITTDEKNGGVIVNQKELPEVVDTNTYHVEQIMKLVSMLETRLEPVLNYRKDPEGVHKEDLGQIYGSPMAERIFRNNIKMEDTREVLERILNILEV